ncbi:amidophosphoribosyltransferase [Hornefia butyriciproducens]|uniref:amidophosphoribosyltransferase n=1 Tax=Hornefia butyriciproducens TaxID=2652293 RepID=UPI0023F4948D|nr:amidophosphoribosyltransferase [Hornefia butyriciproducens]MCI7326443.1 amidophosphoribosyltransferase [Clostridiales bacterium]MCI7680519.1 amidophosphoribosyltransferase [Clostridiales bacterium]MDD6299640.1 amidophosphoribosyltransferase [Hornefia butyriciproducens]MDY2990828.1 amidophosphoribosyltransferase [Hornefia butyriciproducens]MDY5423168.1 amidophosphoribosyltransferase [Hornefia butyriciproducens]
MGGFFGVASKTSCTNDLFFGIDYHSHLGTRRGGMAVYGEDGFHRSIHNIENSPFRTKFDGDLDELEGRMGIGCISDMDPQPLLIRSHHGSYALTTVGKINNVEELVNRAYERGNSHFMEMSGGKVNDTELVGVILDQAGNLVDGLRLVQESVDGSMSILLMTPTGIYCMRDRLGRTPVVIGRKDGAFCASFESSAYINLGYEDHYELGPGEIVHMTCEGIETLSPAREEMKICTFLWVYYGYPTASYEGVNVEAMRYRCGSMLAKRDDVDADIVAGVPDSGIAHAIGYANESGIPYARPFIKYTPTWPRSFMPTRQSQRDLIAHMKLIPVQSLIHDRSLLLIDDSIVRGTQLGQTVQYLYQKGAKAVHIRPACPPLMYGCRYLNFSRSRSEYDYITRRIIREREGEDVKPEVLADYADPDSTNYCEMLEEIRRQLGFTTLAYQRLDDLIESTGIEPCRLCTYCWNGEA